MEEKKLELDETTPSSFRQTTFNPEQNPKAILKQETLVQQGSLSHLKMIRNDSHKDLSHYQTVQVKSSAPTPRDPVKLPPRI